MIIFLLYTMTDGIGSHSGPYSFDSTWTQQANTPDPDWAEWELQTSAELDPDWAEWTAV